MQHMEQDIVAQDESTESVPIDRNRMAAQATDQRLRQRKEQLDREGRQLALLYLFYVVVIFIAIRLWALIIEKGTTTGFIIGSVCTLLFLYICIIHLRYVFRRAAERKAAYRALAEEEFNAELQRIFEQGCVLYLYTYTYIPIFVYTYICIYVSNPLLLCLYVYVSICLYVYTL
jgi:hypothetical protein